MSLNIDAILLLALFYLFTILFIYLFRGEITTLSSGYNISGLVPVCWLLFQCF